MQRPYTTFAHIFLAQAIKVVMLAQEEARRLGTLGVVCVEYACALLPACCTAIVLWVA